MSELRSILASLEALDTHLTLEAPGGETMRIGRSPDTARVTLHTADATAALMKGDHLRLAEAYMHGEIDVEGDWNEVFKIAEVASFASSWVEALGFWLRLRLGRRRYNRDAVAFHYDQSCDFFLPWFDRWRSYSHGFYARPDDDLTDAQARKLQYAIDALGLEPGMDVLDMGAGWGCFTEYAGLRGIRVHGITISEEQYRFVTRLIRERDLPCSVEKVDLLDYRPEQKFDGAVFMGTLEHVPDYWRVTKFLRGNLRPGARVYADFCARRNGFLPGKFMRRYLWPGPVTYVNLQGLIRELGRGGFDIHELRDDTLSYAYTVRDWADRLEGVRAELASKWSEQAVRVFLLFLRGSHYFLTHGHTQAYHLVAGRGPAPLRALP